MAPRPAVRRVVAAVALTTSLFALAPLSASATTPEPIPDTGGADTSGGDTTPVTVTTPASPPVTTPDNGGDDDVPWPLIIAGGAALIALIALIAAMSRRKPAPPTATVQPTAGAPSHHNQAAQDRGYALGSAQWVHDNFTMELLSATPEAAQRRWNTDRARFDDATIRAQRFSSDPQHGLAWQSLAQSLSLLGASMDTLIQLRTSEQPDPQLVHEATDVVQRHRAQLANDIATLWPTLQT